MRTWFVIMLTASCGIYTPAPLAPTMAPYVEKLERADVGVIPTNLSGSVHPEGAPADVVANHSNSIARQALPQLEYAGLTEKGMCFVSREKLAQTDDTPIEQIVKPLQEEILKRQDGGMWLQPVTSLKGMSSELRWPPPAGSVRITSVEKLSDEKVTTTEKKRMGGGDYVDVKHDYRIILIELCAAKPAITPATKYLVLGMHLASVPEDPQFETTESGDHEEHNEMVRREHDAFYVWEISDNGPFELDL